MKRILVSGAFGQIGSELTLALRQVYGNANVVAADIRPEAVEAAFGSISALGIALTFDAVERNHTSFEALWQARDEAVVAAIVQ